MAQKPNSQHPAALFNEAWYRRQLSFNGLGIPAKMHYQILGWRFGKTPHPLFSTSYYLDQRPDVKRAGVEPFVHFLTHGWRERSHPHPLFDVSFYLSQNPDLGDFDPLTHYLSGGWQQSFRASALFDEDWYIGAYPEILGTGLDPLSHYLMYGRDEGRRPARGAVGTEYLDEGSSVKALFVRLLRVGVRKSRSEPPIKPQAVALSKSKDEVWLSESNVALFRAFKERSLRGQVCQNSIELRFAEIKRELLGNVDFDANRTVLAALESVVGNDGSLAERIVSWGIIPDRVQIRQGSEKTTILANYSKMRLDATERFVLQPKMAGTSSDGPLVSILVPVFRTPLIFLERAILSVLAQTYSNWQLVLVDDYSERPEIDAAFAYYCSIDERVKCVSAPANLGIAGASNLGLSHCDGEFVALLDHDDMLTRDALEVVAAKLTAAPDIDLVYSDECKIDEYDVAHEIFAKPDWSPSLLFNCMYTGHFSVYRKSLVTEVGGFRSEFDFSQDYDLALRASERARRICHIEQVLYGWRMISGSAAAGGKPTARATNIAALQAAVDRRGLEGTVVPLPTANRIVRNLPQIPHRVSLIVPSDNVVHIRQTVASIQKSTTYKHYEIIVVTSSSIVAEMGTFWRENDVRYCLFNDAYNFSAKCNSGAKMATGSALVFFNDDVRVITRDWIDCLLEYLTLPRVGIVGPKLLYEDGSIQHAGMVTGVRRLVGTAFHTFPAETTANFNFAQSVREVSLICGACLAIMKDVFDELDGFDAVNAGIAHSDVDLCFRARQAGYSCIYTPYAQLTHIGHLSIGKTKKKAFKQDKADIYLMKEWGAQCARDPYFPKNMRDLLFIDSQEPFEYFPAVRPSVERNRDILIFSHDLSESGAPRVVLDMVETLIEDGAFVVVISPLDGPMRERIVKAGGHVIVDALALSSNRNVTDLGKNFDLIIANTAVCWPVVRQFAPFTRVAWYLHETALIEQISKREPEFTRALDDADVVLAGSRSSTTFIRKIGYSGSVKEVAYGTQTKADVVRAKKAANAADAITISVLGTVEPRKGQDLVVRGFQLMPVGLRAKCKLVIAGRTNDKHFERQLINLVQNDPAITVQGALEYDAYLERLYESDVIVCASRDDTLPLVSLDALAAGKILVCSKETGTSYYLNDTVSGFILQENTEECIAKVLSSIVENISVMVSVKARAVDLYEQEFTKTSFKARFLSEIESLLIK